MLLWAIVLPLERTIFSLPVRTSCVKDIVKLVKLVEDSKNYCQSKLKATSATSSFLVFNPQPQPKPYLYSNIDTDTPSTSAT
jgi:hypothetical protein